VNATAPLTLPIVAVRRTARMGRKLTRLVAVPALGAAAGMAYRALRRAQPGRPQPVRPQTDGADAAPEPSRPVAVSSDPTHPPINAVDPETLVLPSELPIPSYDALAARDAARALRELTDPDEVATVLQFEEENAKRPSVLTAAQAHLEALRG
jgi:hypothetical protein